MGRWGRCGSCIDLGLAWEGLPLPSAMAPNAWVLYVDLLVGLQRTDWLMALKIWILEFFIKGNGTFEIPPFVWLFYGEGLGADVGGGGWGCSIRSLCFVGWGSSWFFQRIGFCSDLGFRVGQNPGVRAPTPSQSLWGGALGAKVRGSWGLPVVAGQQVDH